MLAFSLAFGCVVGAWAVRNVVSVGKFGLTEEYGAVAVIERFAYNDMTAREFFEAFPYCTPGIGDLAFDHVGGTDSMRRFDYQAPDGFFQVGRGRRDALVAQFHRLDPLIFGIIRDELRTSWWRYLLVSIPLAWCVNARPGWIAGLILVPLFGWACIRSAREKQPLLMLYAAPAVAMLGSMPLPVTTIQATPYPDRASVLAPPSSFLRGWKAGVGDGDSSHEHR